MAKQRGKGLGTLYRRTPKGPWIASWWMLNGKRTERSTRTTDRATAERILAKHVAEVALRRDGVIDHRQDRYAVESRKPLTEHVAAYIDHCRHAGHAERHVDQKAAHLSRLLKATGATRLQDLSADALEVYLAALKDTEKLSARSVNFARQIAVAFMAWCVRTGRAELNPLRVVPKQDERDDRRRVRRPLTDDELARLLTVARRYGRECWYLAAALGGLRKGDMQRLTWADVDFADGTITIQAGKAKRVDVVPMHPQLADALRRRLDAYPALATAPVWPDTLTDLTRQKDFLRAGIARREVVTDDSGNPIMVGEGEHAKPKTRIVATDEEGRVIDLHALRTTLGTQLARAGVTPQVAQRIMRHSDYRTTLRHYTVLGLVDTAAAVDRLPSIGGEESHTLRATGTTAAAPANPQLFPQQLPRQMSRGTGNHSAVNHHESGGPEPGTNAVNPDSGAAWRGVARGGTMGGGKTRGRNSVVECQSSKLTPFPAGEMEVHPVSSRVNSPRIDDAGCLEPLKTSESGDATLFG